MNEQLQYGTVEYYSTIKRNKILTYVIKKTELGDHYSKQSKLNRKDKHCLFSFIYRAHTHTCAG